MRSLLTGSILTVAALAVVSLTPTPAAAQQPPAAPGGPGAQGAAPGGPGGGRAGRGGRGANRPPAGPTPHLPNDPYLGANAGKPDLGGNSQAFNATGRGIWQVPYIIDMQKQGKAVDGGPVVVPFTAKGQAAFDLATKTQSKDDPEGFCLPPGVPRMMYTPYPAEILQLPNRIVFIYEGGAHVWRNIWMDGRPQPKDPNPTYLGYSTGKWDGDTLVVDTVGMNDRTWLDAAGHQHGEQLHVTERFTRTDSNTLRIEATIDDPEYYTKPWTTVTQATWYPNQEILEYICQENNRDLKHLVGTPGSK